MGPEWWILAGLVGAVTLIIIGWSARRYEVDIWKFKHTMLLEELEKVLEDSERGAESAKAIIRAERRLTTISMLPARERTRMLLGKPNNGTTEAGSGTGGSEASPPIADG